MGLTQGNLPRNNAPFQVINHPGPKPIWFLVKELTRPVVLNRVKTKLEPGNPCPSFQWNQGPYPKRREFLGFGLRRIPGKNVSLRTLVGIHIRICVSAHERGVLHDHQTALAKMRQYKKKKIYSTVQGPGEVSILLSGCSSSVQIYLSISSFSLLFFTSTEMYIRPLDIGVKDMLGQTIY